MGKTITKTKLLLVEGNHEVQFFEKLLGSMPKTDIQVMEIGGKYQFNFQIQNLPRYDGYKSLESVGIVRDADESFSNTFSSVQNALERAGLPVPDQPMSLTVAKPRFSIYIIPDNINNGDLECLCMESVCDDPIIECVIQYFECLRDIEGRDHPHLSKAKVQVYLAKESDGDIHMGIAAQRDIWHWDNSAFEEIKNYLMTL